MKDDIRIKAVHIIKEEVSESLLDIFTRGYDQGSLDILQALKDSFVGNSQISFSKEEITEILQKQIATMGAKDENT